MTVKRNVIPPAQVIWEHKGKRYATTVYVDLLRDLQGKTYEWHRDETILISGGG